MTERDLNVRQRHDLDNYITGHYGEDQVRQRSLFPHRKRDPDVCQRKHGGADTSIMADQLVNKARDRELIYGIVRAAGAYGQTLDEVSVLLDRPCNRISGRFTELRVAGRLTMSDRMRPTRTGAKARVYVAA